MEARLRCLHGRRASKRLQQALRIPGSVRGLPQSHAPALRPRRHPRLPVPPAASSSKPLRPNRAPSFCTRRRSRSNPSSANRNREHPNPRKKCFLHFKHSFYALISSKYLRMNELQIKPSYLSVTANPRFLPFFEQKNPLFEKKRPLFEPKNAAMRHFSPTP